MINCHLCCRTLSILDVWSEYWQTVNARKMPLAVVTSSTHKTAEATWPWSRLAHQARFGVSLTNPAGVEPSHQDGVCSCFSPNVKKLAIIVFFKMYLRTCIEGNFKSSMLLNGDFHSFYESLIWASKPENNKINFNSCWFSALGGDETCSSHHGFNRG